MTELSVLHERRRSLREARARRARRRRTARLSALTLLAGLIAMLAFMAAGVSDEPPRALVHARTQTAAPVAPAKPGYHLSPAPVPLRVKLKLPLRSGLLFDVHTGQVLWEQRAEDLLPIASLTKMMTALVVVAHASPNAPVMVTPAAVHFSGSGVGLLPLGKRVQLRTMLYGLMLPSGNDAAIALAQHVAGTRGRFIAMMNTQARAMGLTCTHFNTVSGIVDQDNYSCASDLAIIAHAVLTQPLLAQIVAARDAVLPFPIKGGKLYLYNNNPLLRSGYPGTDGVKTGYTTAAGRCLVASARRGGAWLGVVLLHSADPPGQAQRLLDAGFAALRS
ncbi:MAG: D-alanyl-D-alanine carboxypeptidase [Solirubrobacterales bacterium]|nr:D-alanyl-D-alanine carboxypeptidase [Solirubrobacterales bacterium]MBV9474300.1 D-alanyl-D-alanine carboxypeptidase [Solirubrobacterales bacterium]